MSPSPTNNPAYFFILCLVKNRDSDKIKHVLHEEQQRLEKELMSADEVAILKTLKYISACIACFDQLALRDLCVGNEANITDIIGHYLFLNKIRDIYNTKS